MNWKGTKLKGRNPGSRHSKLGKMYSEIVQSSNGELCQVLSLQWDTADAEIMVPYFENPELTNVLPLKPGAAHDVATHALSTARSFFLF